MRGSARWAEPRAADTGRREDRAADLHGPARADTTETHPRSRIPTRTGTPGVHRGTPYGKIRHAGIRQDRSRHAEDRHAGRAASGRPGVKGVTAPELRPARVRGYG
ncbi:hypothetical protein GCM10010421_46300 [Streptomyces glaucus]|uniref:Secreted protein n=1 Tax=Streptomyces glaucus TaxID=284029 RepID=A0ABN3K7T2_9ACTN